MRYPEVLFGGMITTYWLYVDLSGEDIWQHMAFEALRACILLAFHGEVSCMGYDCTMRQTTLLCQPAAHTSSLSFF